MFSHKWNAFSLFRAFAPTKTLFCAVIAGNLRVQSYHWSFMARNCVPSSTNLFIELIISVCLWKITWKSKFIICTIMRGRDPVEGRGKTNNADKPIIDQTVERCCDATIDAGKMNLCASNTLKFTVKIPGIPAWKLRKSESKTGTRKSRPSGRTDRVRNSLDAAKFSNISDILYP